MSYMSQYELYLEESDEEKIEEYIGKKVKNGHEDAITLYIDCVNENVKNEVYQYLSSKNKRGESKVQELCDYYCRLFGYDYYLATGIGTIENTIVIHAWS